MTEEQYQTLAYALERACDQLLLGSEPGSHNYLISLLSQYCGITCMSREEAIQRAQAECDKFVEKMK